MKKYLLIPTVWALLFVYPGRAQQHPSGINAGSIPLSSKSLLIPIGWHPSTSNPPLLIDKNTGKNYHHRLHCQWRYAFSGASKRGRLHGTWMSWYHPGQLCDSGRLVRNIPDGEWKSWYSNGQPRSLRTYNAYMLHRIKDEIARRQAKATFLPLLILQKQIFLTPTNYSAPCTPILPWPSMQPIPKR
ncbi:hypothetical protein [Paraflavitalea speifideaquila]|uniref:toxin-antitoxin system YwqK family antitoxin n=1 Tax=Paraflavitalea speifideaquila TaxID=3076558 RepID=UPI0028E524DC|nr:hypothetical protein [Paraflavitalea speifideiaquila]